jgi:hypothetical protein
VLSDGGQLQRSVLSALSRYRNDLEADLHAGLLNAFLGPRYVQGSTAAAGREVRSGQYSSCWQGGTVRAVQQLLAGRGLQHRSVASQQCHTWWLVQDRRHGGWSYVRVAGP